MGRGNSKDNAISKVGSALLRFSFVRLQVVSHQTHLQNEEVAVRTTPMGADSDESSKQTTGRRFYYYTTVNT